MKSKEYLLTTFEKMYYHEIDRKNTLESNISVPIGILTFEFGLIAVLFGETLKFKGCLALTLLDIVIILSIGLFVVAVSFLFRFFIKYEYAYLENPSEIKTYSDGYAEYLRKVHAKNPDEKLLLEVQDMMLNDYQKACDANVKNNDNKAKFLWRVKLFMIASIVLLFVSIAPYIYLKVTQPSDGIQKIEIVGKN